MKKARNGGLLRPRPFTANARWIVAGLLALLGMAASASPPTIVLVGGMNTGHPDGEHDFADGVLKIERLINASPDFAKLDPNVKVYPVGFPKDLDGLDDASVVLLYFGTVRTDAGRMNPVEEPSVRQVLARLAANGTGIVALHQALTIPRGNSRAPLDEWLGGARLGSTDHTTETAPHELAASSHPVANGLTAFTHLDEYYPTIEFDESAEVTPVLNARIHVQHRGADEVFEEPAKSRVVAWAYERPDGGRAFAYSGGHYLAALDQPQVRTMVLNAILWTAKADVPEAGARTTVPARTKYGMLTEPHPHRVVLPAGDVEVLPQPWGELEWYASRPLGNSTTMTVGRAIVLPGKANPPHWHPNCDEILHVVQGHIMHRVGDREYEMRAGDTVVIPQGTVHNARNIGTEDAVLMVSFNSADRFAIGE